MRIVRREPFGGRALADARDVHAEHGVALRGEARRDLDVHPVDRGARDHAAREHEHRRPRTPRGGLGDDAEQALCRTEADGAAPDAVLVRLRDEREAGGRRRRRRDRGALDRPVPDARDHRRSGRGLLRIRHELLVARELLEGRGTARASEMVGELLREARGPVAATQEEHVGAALRLRLHQIDGLQRRDRLAREQVAAALDAVLAWRCRAPSRRAGRGRREDLHLARVVRAAHARLEQREVGDRRVGGDAPGERGAHADADQADAAHPGQRAHRSDGATDRLLPGRDAMGIVVGPERLAGAVVVDAQRVESGGGERVREVLHRLVRLDALPPERRADDPANVPERSRGSMITSEEGPRPRVIL